MRRTSGLHGSVRLVKLASTKLARAQHLLSGVESDRKCVNKSILSHITGFVQLLYPGSKSKQTRPYIHGFALNDAR